MSNESTIGEDVALAEIASISQEFDITIDHDKQQTILPVVMQGRLYLDGDVIVYTLARPVGQLLELRFSEPTGGQAERAGKGVKAIKRPDGSSEIDVGEATRMVNQLASAMTGVSVGQLLDLRARDRKIMEAIVGFFD
jgi:hypothetical protein